ncbi:potassium channel family protein [Nocardioides sp. CER19]|uniref:potassium channel family protein n=1 Tax=Nocardioides sp. CER19 TaxID=3038538 RepID=UPI00244BC695|nr:potassium channel family protein [Nocardioides sp. CER19]MDH2416013.1 potassium channel family protein [Nocardioides sp. CER19]
MSEWRRVVGMTTAFALVVGLYFVVPVTAAPQRTDVVRLLLSALMLLVLTAVVVWQIRAQLAHPERRIDALLLALVVGVLGFSLAFYVLEQRDPGQVAELGTRVDALYFTMSTLLTVGYGDVHAVGQTARVLVLIQMVYNVVVIAGAAGLITRRMREAAASRVERREERREVRRETRRESRGQDLGRPEHRRTP